MIDLSKITVGSSIWEAWLDWEDASTQIDEYVCSAIKGGIIHLIRKTRWTWVNRAAEGKTFSKTQDWGWARRIEDNDRIKFVVDPEVAGHNLRSKDPADFFPSKEAATRALVPQVKKAIARLKSRLAVLEKQAAPKKKTATKKTVKTTGKSGGEDR